MAIASLALSFLAFIVPFGIASVVMGHISRKQIAKSKGRQSGTGIAFAGLIISYLQFAVVLVLCLALTAVWRQMTRDLDRNPDTRAALVAQLLNVAKSSTTSNRQNAIAALKLIRARQAEYLAAHPDEGYACQFPKLGWDPTGGEELNMRMVNSHYHIDIDQCMGLNNEAQYVVIASPDLHSNPAGTPLLCVDQTGVVRSVDPDFASDLVRVIITERRSCPHSAEPLE
jgi:hypothetical protein